MSREHKTFLRLRLIVPLLVLAACSGCLVPVIVPKADTVLSVYREAAAPQGPVRMGLEWTYFGENADQFVIYGKGAFPREHETWVFWYLWPTTGHPYPDYDRKIRITWARCDVHSDQALCRIEMLLDDGWSDPSAGQTFGAYKGEAQLSFRFRKDKVLTNITGIELRRVDNEQDTLHVSGTVVAKRLDVFHLLAADFDKHWAEFAER